MSVSSQAVNMGVSWLSGGTCPLFYFPTSYSFDPWETGACSSSSSSSSSSKISALMPMSLLYLLLFTCHLLLSVPLLLYLSVWILFFQTYFKPAKASANLDTRAHLKCVYTWLSRRERNFPGISKDINPAALVIHCTLSAPMWSADNCVSQIKVVYVWSWASAHSSVLAACVCFCLSEDTDSMWPWHVKRGWPTLFRQSNLFLILLKCTLCENIFCFLWIWDPSVCSVSDRFRSFQWCLSGNMFVEVCVHTIPFTRSWNAYVGFMCRKHTTALMSNWKLVSVQSAHLKLFIHCTCVGRISNMN